MYEIGAGAESRTPITSLENWDNNRYTTPAHNRGDYSTCHNAVTNVLQI